MPTDRPSPHGWPGTFPDVVHGALDELPWIEKASGPRTTTRAFRSIFGVYVSWIVENPGAVEPFPLAEIREAACLLAPVVVVPSTAPKVKTDAIEYYGAELVTVAPTMAARIAATEELVAEHGYVLIPPFDDRAVIAGQGTTGRSIVPFDRQHKLYLDRVMAVGDRSAFSAQTLAVLAELCATPSRWRHGYGIARDTGLKSGTLYPILLRLADRGLVEACWEDEQPAGRPRRHLYRLTTEGLAAATAALAQAQPVGQVRAGSRIRGRRRVAARAAP